MKLLVYSLNFSPELTGIGKYSGEMVDGLAARGHEVTVVCAPPHYPAWKLTGAYTAGRYSVQTPRAGVTVYRCPLWVPGRPTALGRLLHQVSFALSSLPVLLWLALRERPAVLFAVAPSTFCAPLAWLAARLSGAKAWLHVQDLELDAAFKMGFLRGARLRRACLVAERTLMAGFDQVSTISRRMLRQLACKGVGLARTSLLPNWVDLAGLDPQVQGEAAAAMRQRLGIDAGQKVVLFSGTMNRKQGLEVLVDAAMRLRHRTDIVMLLCGQGEMRARLEAAAEGLAQVRFLDLRPAHELGALLTLADVHLLPQVRDAADLVLPSKLGGMLGSGRPVVAGVDAGSEIAALVKHCGIRVEPECGAGFAAAIQQLCDDEEQRQMLGHAARQFAQTRMGARALLDGLDADLRALAGLGPRTTLPAARAEA